MDSGFGVGEGTPCANRAPLLGKIDLFEIGRLAARFADDVKRGLGEADPRTPLKEAMWEDDPELAAWKKQELERARELAQVRDPNRLAQEVRW